METLQNVKKGLNDIVTGHLIPNNSSFDVSLPSSAVLLLFWMDAARDGSSSPAPASHEIQPGSLSRSEKVPKTPPRRLTRGSRRSTMQTQSDAAKEICDSILFFVESECE